MQRSCHHPTKLLLSNVNLCPSQLEHLDHLVAGISGWHRRGEEFHRARGLQSGIQGSSCRWLQLGRLQGCNQVQAHCRHITGPGKSPILFCCRVLSSSAYTLLPISTQAALVVDEDARARLQALQSVMGSFSTVDALRHYYEDTIQPSLGETSSQSMQPVADMEGVADALRGLSISRVNASTTPNGAHSGSISRLEELERRTRSELKSHSIELSILN